MTVLQNKIYTNKDGDTYKVLRIKSVNDVVVEFVDTKYQCRSRSHLVLSGSVRDFTKLNEERDSWKPHRETFTNNSGETFRSFSKRGKKVRVEFENTGYVTEVFIDNARAGKVKDPYAVSVYGVGYEGNPDKSLPYWKQAKQLWTNMLKRCYSEKDDRGYYGKCFVDSKWHSFEAFLNDLKHLDGFDEWIKGNEDPYYRCHLDKDFYREDNNIYSRNLCRFLPMAYNQSLGKKGKTEEDWA